MVNVCIKIGITIQFENLPCHTILQYIESVQTEWICMTTQPGGNRKLLWHYAINQIKSHEDLPSCFSSRSYQIPSTFETIVPSLL